MALPVLYCGCVTPGSDGGTPAGAMAGPTSGPTGTTPIGGGVGGGKGGIVCAAPMGGGGTMGTKSGKNAAVAGGVKVSGMLVSVVLPLVV